MPTEELQALREQITRFEDALNRVDALARGYEKLARGYKRQRVITIALIVVLAFVIVVGAISTVNLVNLRHNTDDDNSRNAVATLDGCRARNQTNVVVRKRFENFFTALDSFAGTSPNFAAFVAQLKAEDAKLDEIKDRDCTFDNVIDAQDYPAGEGP